MIGNDSVRQPVICAGCEADELACARKASNGGRVCCLACSHVTTRHQTPARHHNQEEVA